jgi:hypothetical protein
MQRPLAAPPDKPGPPVAFPALDKRSVDELLGG